MTHIEFIDLKTPYLQLKKRIGENIQKVLDRGDFILGKEVRELESALETYTNTRYCISCSNGTDALLMALMAKGIGKGDAVFTTPFTFIATAEVISLLGATPVFVDIDPTTFNLSPSSLRDMIRMINNGHTPAEKMPKDLRPAGIIAVDLYGLTAEYKEINEIALENNLFVIEDAAQSFGATYHGKKSCSLSDIATTSFFPAKPLGCYGDGGAIFTDNDTIRDTLESIRVHGKGVDKYDNVRIGINGRLDTLQAAILLAKLEIFDQELDMRNIVASRYTQHLAEVFTTPSNSAHLSSAWAQYTPRSSHRDLFINELKKHSIPSNIYYPKPLHLQKAFGHLGYEKGSLINSELASEEVFSLPMHPYLDNSTQEFIITTILNIAHERNLQ